jgi:glutamate dehydrogenase (NADP+)
MIIEDIHQACLEAAEPYGSTGNYVLGANTAGFMNVVDAMSDQGLV